MCKIYSDDGVCDASTSTTRKARKTHRCECCRAIIKPGDTYRYSSWIFEGGPGSDKACLLCVADRDEFGKAHAFYPFVHCFLDYLTECIADGDEESEAKWKPMLARIDARREAARVP